jgi:serine/threonine protein kinase
MTTVDDRPRTKTRLRGVAPVEVPANRDVPRVIGRYEIVDVIGRGAMGVVYKARDPLLDRTVAIKTIVGTASLGRGVRKAFLERFDREAKAAARIAHPAIVTIFDVGIEGDAPFLVMEYLPGETLADRLDRTRLPLGQAVQAARDLASALGCAHKERIVHRDVKPANVLHAGENRWKLADFGIARMPDSDLTQVGIFMGTPGYAPPEAIREGTYTVQADVFAWGACFYELLCGRVPYEGPDTQTTNSYVLKAEAPTPRNFDPSVPEPLAAIALKALRHDPKVRFANGNDAEAALVEAWDKCLSQGLVPLSAFASASGLPGRAAGGGAPAPQNASPASPPPTPGGKKLPAKAAAAPLVVESERDETDGPTTLFQGGPGGAPSGRSDAVPAAMGALKTDRVAPVKPTPAPPMLAKGERAGVLQPVKKSGAGMWIALVILLLAAGAAAGIYFYLKQNGG